MRKIPESAKKYQEGDKPEALLDMRFVRSVWLPDNKTESEFLHLLFRKISQIFLEL